MAVTHSRGQAKKSQVRCDGCLMDLSITPWMQCVECFVDLCPMCFFQNPHVNTHIQSHPYRIIKSLSFTPTDRDWSILEEFLFADALVIHGLGNWEDMAAYIGGKTPEEVRRHFFLTYKLSDDTAFEGEVGPAAQSNPMSSEIAGYMPLRQDFETEYENEAEVAIKDLVLAKEDSSLEKEMKEVLIGSYMRTLRNRKLCKHLIFERGLINIKNLHATEKLLCKGGKGLLSLMKPFMKVLSNEEFNLVFRGLYAEMKMREKLRALLDEKKGGRKRAKLEKAKNLPAAQTPIDLFKEDHAAGEAKKELQVKRSLANTGGSLSNAEKNLCDILRISYESYLSIKRVLVTGFLKAGCLRASQAKNLTKIDDQRISKIYSFFIKSGWILNS